MACPECGRLRRVYESALILEFLADYPLADLRCLTLVNPADALPAGAVHTLDPRKLLTRYRRQFERVGISKSSAFVIAYLDGEWDEGWDVYQPHVHAIVWGVNVSALEELVKKWPKTKRVRVRKRLEPIDDLARVVAYLDKTFWPCVARKNNPKSIYPHGKRRPPEKIEIEILKWMNARKSKHLKLLYGVKSYGNSIVKT